MPLQPYTRENILVEISDLVIGETIIKRKALLLSILQEEDEHQVLRLKMRVQIQRFASVNGGYGPRIDATLPPSVYTLSADNETAVHAETGAIVSMQGTRSAEEWAAELAGIDQPLMLQGDYFQRKRNYEQVNEATLARVNILYADRRMGKFNQ